MELCTPDPEQAEAFYGALLGWTVRAERLGATTYRMCSIDGRDVAGISDATTLHGGRPRGWLTYFAVDDVAASARQAVTLGGELVSPPRYLPRLAPARRSSTSAPPSASTRVSRASASSSQLAGALCWNKLNGEPAETMTYTTAPCSATPPSSATTHRRPGRTPS